MNLLWHLILLMRHGCIRVEVLLIAVLAVCSPFLCRALLSQTLSHWLFRPLIVKRLIMLMIRKAGEALLRLIMNDR